MTESCIVTAEIAPSISTNIYDKQTTINQELPSYPWLTQEEWMWKNPIIEPLSERMERLQDRKEDKDGPEPAQTSTENTYDAECIVLPDNIENDPVNHPAHYTYGTIETIDYIEDKGQTYNLGNVVKYVSRAGHKQDAIEDLKKAVWYLNREISRLEKEKAHA